MASYQNKLDNIIKLMSDRTGISNAVPGTITYQIAQSFAYESFLQDQKIEDDFSNNGISTAVSSYLDDIGDNFFGVARRPERKPFISESMKVLKFSVLGDRIFGSINNNNDITLPAGTLIYGTLNGLNVKFALTSNYILPANYTEVYVAATLIQGPSNTIPQNTLINHSFTEYSDYQNKSLVVTNNMPITTGRAIEDDDIYRYRISNALRSFNQSNMDGILSIVRNVAGVSNATVYQAKDGAGTFTIYVQGITPITSDEVISDVELVLLQESVSPWSSFNVVKPDYIGLAFDVDVTLISNNTLSSQAQFIDNVITNIETYINNFTDSKFYISDLERAIIDIDKNIADITLSNFLVYRGTDEFRQSEEIDLTTTKYIETLSLEKIIVEPSSSAISVIIS